MSRISFENYGKGAKISNSSTNTTVLAGRYATQEESERYILLDVVEKLEISPYDSVLDIGTGPGSIAIPLSFLCKKMTVIDHLDVLDGLRKRCSGIQNLHFQSGNFLDMETDERFNKIIVYSVLHYLTDNREVIKFIEKAISILHKGGVILFGDLPNISKKARFLESEFGKKFVKKWNKIPHSSIDEKVFENDERTPTFDDAMILSMVEKIRSSGYHAYVLPQSQNLPFGYTREDILVVNPNDEN